MNKHSFRLVAAIVSLSGCGDDDGDRPYRSGVDEEENVSTLDDDDKAQICRTLDAHVDVTISLDEVTRLACLPAAVLLGGSAEGCERLLNECVQNAPPPVRVRADANAERACFDSLAECNANVGQLESCVNVSLDAALDFLERVTCSRFDDDEVRSKAESMQTAQGCADLRASCDDFGPLL
jgi:hypothetical protein